MVAVLTEQPDYQRSRKYWNKLKQRLSEEGNETVTNCHQLKLKAADGKRRFTDVANTEQLLRIIQSIPSKKAEPFKLWLAQVGKDRIEETLDPELLAETATKEISQSVEPSGFEQNKSVARRGGNIAGNARKELEQELGHSVITSQNALQLNHVVAAMVEASRDISETESGPERKNESESDAD